MKVVGKNRWHWIEKMDENRGKKMDSILGETDE